ncbi:MAG: nickel-dependent hydrogenase large subunit [Promethearchaeota archaeon]
MLKVVDVCMRVEGHGNLEIFMKDDEISHVEFKIGPYRGFENLLIGKKITDVPRIISRICGLCHASQSIVSCKTIETMYNIKPHQQAVFIRRILMVGELLKSHAMHFYFQSFPDLLEIFNLSKNTLNLNDLLKYNSQLTSNIFDIIKIGNDLDILFGGRSIHLITPIPGGTIFQPSLKNIKIAQKYLEKSSFILEAIIEEFINIFSQFTPPEEFMLPNPYYLALNRNKDYDRYAGVLTLKKSNTKYEDFSEIHYNSYFDKDPNLHGIDFNIENNRNYIVGPIARNQIIEGYGTDQISSYLNFFQKSWRNNLLYANFLRLIEMDVEVIKTLYLLEDPILKNSFPLPEISTIKNQNGIAVVEAPRGTLIHHYRINNKKIIEEAKLFIATEINLPLINKMITQYAQKLYEKKDLQFVKKKIQMMIRAFDPCISCATH